MGLGAYHPTPGWEDLPLGSPGVPQEHQDHLVGMGHNLPNYTGNVVLGSLLKEAEAVVEEEVKKEAPVVEEKIVEATKIAEADVEAVADKAEEDAITLENYTKAQLVAAAEHLGVDGVSEKQLKDEVIGAIKHVETEVHNLLAE